MRSWLVAAVFAALIWAAPIAHAQDDPKVVRVGVLVNDIQQLDLQSHSYNVDMYMWFKWKDRDIDPSRSFEFLNAFELWGHTLTYDSTKPERLADGSYYQVLRNQGKFNTKLPLGRYPFDTQHLRIAIEDSQEDASGLVYVPDERPIAVSQDLSLPGWKFEKPSVEVVNNKYVTDFGDPSEVNPDYSRFVVDVPVTRPQGTYALKLLLPMLLVALTAALALWVHPRYVEGRIGIVITALLTLVALQLTTQLEPARGGLPAAARQAVHPRLRIRRPHAGGDRAQFVGRRAGRRGDRGPSGPPGPRGAQRGLLRDRRPAHGAVADLAQAGQPQIRPQALRALRDRLGRHHDVADLALADAVDDPA